MKKILMLCLFISLLTRYTQKLENPKYKAGNIVYMKPDSTKAIIVSNDVIMGEYEFEYSINHVIRRYCKETDIYGKE